jgi:hypothetical protein
MLIFACVNTICLYKEWMLICLASVLIPKRSFRYLHKYSSYSDFMMSMRVILTAIYVSFNYWYLDIKDAFWF